MNPSVHPSSVVEDGARLGAGVAIGPFCHIGAGVEIGDGATLLSHVVVGGRTRIGARARIFPFAAVGLPSQDFKAALAQGALTIGDDCVIREGVTINAGAGEGTRIGARCVFLAASHVAHDCRLGDDVILSNQVLLGGHVEIGDHAMIGGATAVHQHVRIGAHAFVGGLSGVEGDVVPFALASGNRAHLFGLNRVGLQRRGFAPERIERLRRAYRLLFAREARPLSERIDCLSRDFAGDADIAAIVEFLRAPSTRPLCAPRARAESP
ncbi:acyl-ACP--UDP-N-acetylglucosamine O-acyltransferase [Methylocystis hirsuta]|uniref:Acyl-ACP--UDP-N-acetylglucosamine O-acyltransferase n=1 Tax=Methylocystis hirsuta TaxID=369798 RepID=A0A3M9XM25_9HYPH|nr:acyl-ACP--UDP-N-acetylglucosamine O-acyltransferase [Methylocystis hirsuta]RNJ49327.1 acyl-ACP--UDP-N-acetylglucosamine O-acyltransferase [Methylocystis hirsuta]